MKKPFYKNIFLLTSQKGREAIVKDFINSNAGKKILKQKDLILICIAGNKKTYITKTEYHENVKTLNLRCEESYHTLSTKTFKSIEYCVKNFTFERLHKCDDNKEINLKHYHINKNQFDLQGCCKTDDIPRKDDRWINRQKGVCMRIPDEFLRKGLTKCDRRTFKRWASKKNLQVDAWYYDELVWYGNWKPYSVSYKFAKILSKAESYEEMYKNHLGGCEDHMIGKVYKDLQLYFKLTAE